MTNRNKKKVDVQFYFHASPGGDEIIGPVHLNCVLLPSGKPQDRDFIKAGISFAEHYSLSIFEICLTSYTVEGQEGFKFNPGIPFWPDDGEINFGPID